MNALQTLFLLAAGLSVAFCGQKAPIVGGLLQFGNMIWCKMPNNRSLIWQLTDYGCYCGKGGSGTPVDDLDRCCQVHDKCYGDAQKLKACWSIFHNPYTKWYTWSCDKANKTVTCNENNSVCGMFICECDRKATECFAKSTYNKEHRHWPQERCQ